MPECVFCERTLDPHEVDFGFCENAELCSANARILHLKKRVTVLSETVTVARISIKMAREHANSAQDK